LPKLERVTYESRLGSYRDKVERIRAIARWFTEQWFNLGMSMRTWRRLTAPPNSPSATSPPKCSRVH